MQGKKQYSEQLFKSFQLSERVPQDNFYRRLKELLDFKWLYAHTKKYYGTEGQASIDPVVFFKLILIGYLENLGSDRRIINTVSMRLDMLFFIGYDIDEPLPWHSTLSRTRQLYGETVFKELFRQVLKQCIDKGMVAGRRQAIDSVAVKANASMSKLAEKEVLDDGDNYTDEPGTDLSPLLKGLRNDSCQCPHWGYVVEGTIKMIYDDGTEETLNAGDVFYMPPGHTAIVEKDLTLLDFSPENELKEVTDHIAKKMAG